MDLCVATGRDHSKEIGDEIGPLVWDIVDGHFTESIAIKNESTPRISTTFFFFWKRGVATRLPRSNFDLAVLFRAQGKLEHGAPQLSPGLLRDLDDGLAIRAVGIPVGLDEEAERCEGRLADGGVYGGMGSDVRERDGEGGVIFGVVQGEFGLMANGVVGGLGVGEDLNEFVIHGAGPQMAGETGGEALVVLGVGGGLGEQSGWDVQVKVEGRERRGEWAKVGACCLRPVNFSFWWGPWLLLMLDGVDPKMPPQRSHNAHTDPDTQTPRHGLLLAIPDPARG